MKCNVIKIMGDGSAVYLLKRKGIVIYVGQSKNVLNRFVGHSDKKYDEVNIFWVPRKLMKSTERNFILKYRPALNIKPCHPLIKKPKRKLNSLWFRLKRIKVLGPPIIIKTNQKRGLAHFIAKKLKIKIATRKSFDFDGFEVYRIK